VAALEAALRTASLLEQLYSWSLLSLQCKRLSICPSANNVMSGDVIALRFAQLPCHLKKLVLEFAHEGPTVERPSVWQPLRGKEKAIMFTDSDMNGYIRVTNEDSFIGFPTLADHCRAASDLHPGNEFVIGQNDLHADLKWQNARAQEFHQTEQNQQQLQKPKKQQKQQPEGDHDREPSKRQKRRQKDKLRKERQLSSSGTNRRQAF